MRDQEIYREIGSSLWGVFHKDADRVIMFATVFENDSGAQLSFYRGEERLKSELGSVAGQVAFSQLVLIRELQTVPPFDKEPFTHFKYMLTDKGKMNVEFAYIPEWDSWPSVFMKGLSQFSKEEAMEFGSRRYEAWKQAAERFKKEPY